MGVGFSQFFRLGDLCWEQDRGGGKVCPPSQSSELLHPSAMGASSQEPSRTGGFLQPKANPAVRVVAGSVRLLLRNLFPYLYVRGMGLVTSSKTASVYSVN